MCLAIVYHGLARQPDAAAVLEKLMEFAGDASAYQYAEVHAQWGDTQAALGWLEKALELRDPALEYTKADPLLDPLRSEPRFQAVLRELQFPGEPSARSGRSDRARFVVGLL